MPLTIPSLGFWFTGTLGSINIRVRQCVCRCFVLTGLLNWSLFVVAAVPATNLPAFARLADTPLTVNGSGSVIPSVSLIPSTSIAEGGAMI